MVKNTVRFHEGVVEEIEALVAEGVLESKSEFYRFAAEYVLEQITDGYEPHMVDFSAVKAELMPADVTTIPDATPQEQAIPFLESVAIVRQYALRGEIADAEDFIDHHYEPNQPDALLLEEFLQCYRHSAQGIETTD